MPTSSTSSSPSTAAATLSAETLESDLLAHLASASALEDIHATLLCSLQRMGWTDKIRRLSLELLRAGRCERFDEVVEAVVASVSGRKHPAVLNSNGSNNDDEADGYFDNVDVRIPEAVVEQGVRALKDVLREVVVLEDDDDGSHETSRSAADGGGGGGGGGRKTSMGEKSLKNGDTSPAKKVDKKPKTGKQVK